MRNLVIAIILGLLVAGPSSATMMTRPLSLDQVTSEATRIFHARVVDVAVGRDESGAPATWVTVQVTRSLKGTAASKLVFKQFGAADPLPDGAVAVVAGLPQYRSGEEVVLFLRGDSGRGFTSPVGLGQGVYRVATANGHRSVRPDTAGPDAQRRGRPDLGGAPLEQDLDTFLAHVASLVALER